MEEKQQIKILYIDDEPVTAKLVQVKLGKIYGRENIILANNGELGLEMFKQEKPSLVLLDIMMPGMSGYEVYDELEKLFEELDIYVPVIFLTAKTGKENKIIGLGKGVSAYLTKPFDTQMLITVVESKLKIKELNDKIGKLQAQHQAIIAHDMRSPSAGIDMNAQSMRLRLNKIKEKLQPEMTADKVDEVKTMIEKVDKSINNIRLLARHQLSLVDNISDFSKIKSGIFNLKLNPLKFSEVVDLILLEYSIFIERKNIELIIENNSINIIKLDRLAVEQILSNLLGNAVKFTKEGGKIIVRTKDIDKNTVSFSIKDNGYGISESVKGKLFRRFAKGDTPGSKTGLGLFITKNLVTAQNGFISVESKKGEGTEFYLTLSQAKINNKVLVTNG